jgi:DAACS family dicarboxylate/amino acid:cation (Na+ or H+) symporter
LIEFKENDNTLGGNRSNEQRLQGVEEAGEERAHDSRGFLGWWHATPLYARIVGAMLAGGLTGYLMGPGAQPLREPGQLILRLLGALAPPLILVAVVHALMTANLKGRVGLRLFGLLALNTSVAILIGLLVANVVQPGRLAHLPTPAALEQVQRLDPWAEFASKIPTSLLKPLVDNNVISVILVAVAFGVALRRVREQQQAAGESGYQAIEAIVNTAFSAFMVMLHWIIDLVPIAVFGVVAATVGKEGFGPFEALGAFVVSVLLALFLQATYYLVRVRFGSWVRPGRLLARRAFPRRAWSP